MAKDSLRFLGDYDNCLNHVCNILDKDTSIFNYIQYMFDRSNRMFHYKNLPDTIPEPMLEYMLQVYGSVAIVEYDSNIYALRANFGGPPDPYYRPTQAVLANPALGITGTFRIVNHLPPYEKSIWESYPPCVRFLNDSQIQGLFPLFSRYATQLAENDVSIRSAQINLRQQTIIAADTGPEIESANSYIKSLEAGELSSIQKRPFTDGVQVLNAQAGNSNVVMQLIELQQYIKASWFNEIGLNSNFNMKRQYMTSEEINSSADITLPLVDNMFEARKMAVDSINQQFGTDITVEKDSAWEIKQIQANQSVSVDLIDSSFPNQFEESPDGNEEPEENGEEEKEDIEQLEDDEKEEKEDEE